MADPPDTPNPPLDIWQIDYGGSIDHSKIKSPFTILPIPEDCLPFLGQIAVLWGAFELSMENLLIAILDASNELNEDWKRQKFEQKRKTIIVRAKSYFINNQAIADCIEEILNDSIPIQEKRNLLLHGRISLFSPQSGTFALCARGRKNKQIIEATFTRDSLEILAYELAHLAGRMNAVISLGYAMRFPELSSPDKSALRDFLLKYHPHRTRRAIPRDPPRSSQE